jgi:hypothetical protein
VLAIASGGAAFLTTPPSYADSVQVLFLGSAHQPGEKALTNPFLEMGSTLVSTADVIGLRVSTAQTAQTLADEGATSDYEVALDQSTPAPVLLVTTKDADPGRARRTSQALVEKIQSILQALQLQAGAPPSTWVTSTVISSLPKPARKLTQSIRPAIVAGAGVFTLTMFVLFLLEGRSRRRPAIETRPGRSIRPPAPGPVPVSLPPSVSVSLPAPDPAPDLRPRRLTAPSEPGSQSMW